MCAEIFCSYYIHKLERCIWPKKGKQPHPPIMWVFPPPSDSSSSLPSPLTPIPYRIHTPKLTQVVTGQNFHYFKLRLHSIPDFFTLKKSWNHDYPPGQQIYSDTPSAAALRTLISSEHSILYSGRSSRDGNSEGSLERSPRSFFSLLAQNADSPSALFGGVHSAIKSGFEFLTSAPAKEEGPLQIYTYVLMDRSLRFSRCGAGTSVDMSSKHALHAGAQPEVFYAGEFWVEPDPGSGWGSRLFIDNNSGTFAPPKSDLWRMKGLIEANFPGIAITVLDYQDAEWGQRRKPGASKEEGAGAVQQYPNYYGWVGAPQIQ